MRQQGPAPRLLDARPAATVDVRRDGPFTVCALRGALDASAPASVRDAFRSLMFEPRLVIDVGALSFVDAAGLRLILMLVAQCRERGGSASIAAPSRLLLRLLHAICVDKDLELHATVEDALAAGATRWAGP